MLNNNIIFNGKIIENYCDIGNIQKYNNANKIFKSNYNVLTKEEESISFVDNKVIKFFIDKNINMNRLERTK